MVPVLPFFWLTGTVAVLTAAVVSLFAHFSGWRRKIALHSPQLVGCGAGNDGGGRRGGHDASRKLEVGAREWGQQVRTVPPHPGGRDRTWAGCARAQEVHPKL